MLRLAGELRCHNPDCKAALEVAAVAPDAADAGAAAARPPVEASQTAVRRATWARETLRDIALADHIPLQVW